METTILLFMILVIFLFTIIKKKETFADKKYVVSHINRGEWGFKFIKIILPKIKKKVEFKQVEYPDLVIESVFPRKEIVKKKNYKLITISGESYKSKNHKKALLNILSLKTANKKDIWFPYICWGFNDDKLDILINKKFKKIKILGNGEIKDKINIEANFFSKSAKSKLEKNTSILKLKK